MDLVGKPPQLCLQPVIGPLHGGELLLPFELEELPSDLVGYVRAQRGALGGDLHMQHAGTQFIGEADFARQYPRRQFNLLLRREWDNRGIPSGI